MFIEVIFPGSLPLNRFIKAIYWPSSITKPTVLGAGMFWYVVIVIDQERRNTPRVNISFIIACDLWYVVLCVSWYLYICVQRGSAGDKDASCGLNLAHGCPTLPLLTFCCQSLARATSLQEATCTFFYKNYKHFYFYIYVRNPVLCPRVSGSS